MKLFKKYVVVGLIICSAVSLTSQTAVLADNSSESKRLYDNYNLERMKKSAIQRIAEDSEVNAVLMTMGLQDWDMFSQGYEKIGKFESVDKTFDYLNEDIKSHSKVVDEFKDKSSLPMEEQAELDEPIVEPENIDYFAISDVSINYYFDKAQSQLSQVVSITTGERNYRSMTIYDKSGQVVNYLEV